MKTFGAFFKETRKFLGLTQKDIAKKMNMTTAYISAIERDITFPRAKKMGRLVNKGLGLKSQELDSFYHSWSVFVEKKNCREFFGRKS